MLAVKSSESAEYLEVQKLGSYWSRGYWLCPTWRFSAEWNGRSAERRAVSGMTTQTQDSLA